ncbi:MAG: GTPase HflX, partial [Rhodospirillaceae bacterium]|nr:GTPase HflX [Rhodospirillaceae bacterium]
RRIVVSDTVGFISDLPTELIAAFRATLEEVALADVILHVRDIARPDAAAQAESVRRILGDLVAGEKLASATIEVWNKIDRVDGPGLERLHNRADRANDRIRLVSALTGAGVDGLCAEVEDLLGAARRRMAIRVPYEKGAALAWLYDRGAVVERTDDEAGSLLIVDIEQSDCRTLDSRYGLSTASGIVETPARP